MPDLTLAPDAGAMSNPQQFQALLAAVSRTVSEICASSDNLAGRLDQIEEMIEETAALEGVRVLRFRLEECLQALREENRRQRREISETFNRLKTEVQAPQESDTDAPQGADHDKVTGLESRESAEREMAAAKARSGASFAALFVVDRLHVINAQFGYATGDRILREVCGHLRSSLSQGDRLYRWTGPAFLAVMDRGDAPGEIETEVQRIANSQLVTAVQIGNGGVRLPVACTSLLLPLNGASAVRELASRMDAFTGSRARH